MYKLKWLLCSIPVLLIYSCGENTNQQKAKAAGWTQEERQEYMRNCASSAAKSYQDRGLQPDSATIFTLCKCSGEIIEKKYAYNDASNVKPEEIKAIMTEAAQKCLTK